MKRLNLSLVFVCFALPVLVPCVLGQDGVLEEPDFPACPDGYFVVGLFGGADSNGLLMNPKPSFRTHEFSLECLADLTMIGWAGEGHPEIPECNLTGGTDPFCNQHQDFENFVVELDGAFLGEYRDAVGEIENAWFPFGPWDTSADAGLHELLFAHTLETSDVESVLYKATLCGRCIEEGLECRVTGGGVNSSTGTALWNGTLAKAIYIDENGTNNYSFGGQAGAPTASQPQPYGEWVHHQKRGPDGSFVFHAGTASAPEGTEIDLVECSDSGWCVQARPAPAKQIDFEGIGTFKNIRKPSPELGNVVAGETFHWFEVHIEDLGEPGKGKGKKTEPPLGRCPPEGSAGMVADCDCPDFYYIAIYEAFDPQTESPNVTDIIYQVYGYIKGGNLQIHPPLD